MQRYKLSHYSIPFIYFALCTTCSFTQTFVNQQPLRGTTRPIERGDGLRFGYGMSFARELIEYVL